ncbi:hypothetical protein JG687_00015773 [Phytophthora cactorum]|uniref:Uncharacterized protein n=1 Tax=Phytophthora cactorum TaxID=29920 RepID=A0A329RFI1_9STRA|nr:hypothetical protein Pcac1_g5548 [Phytophthora cactorum]KAG2798050.1 hypothetical protein PC111_g21018 [Phytophthora cactorum]KAG2798124.1 hypothetical protein PC112_g21493 [Phytophthora cactorum]KAG2828520.1 hypothetical protein PC113_g21452 [Phytophthora cactorum]KAG2877213.1 hypothetical protein PC114_g23773 [Phytophthora cactorum]
MPEAVIFSVNFFNAFYVASSMQNASSTITVIVIMAIHTALTLHSRTSSVMEQLCGEFSANDVDKDLLEVACLVFRTPAY